MRTFLRQGKLYVRGDSKVFRFLSSKEESLFLQRKNPRKIAWTQVYRRAHKKGITEEVAKKRSRKTVKHQRGIVGADLATILSRRNQKPADRDAARDAAKQAAKEQKKAAEEKRKASRVRQLPVGSVLTPLSDEKCSPQVLLVLPAVQRFPVNKPRSVWSRSTRLSLFNKERVFFLSNRALPREVAERRADVWSLSSYFFVPMPTPFTHPRTSTHHAMYGFAILGQCSGEGHTFEVHNYNDKEGRNRDKQNPRHHTRPWIAFSLCVLGRPFSRHSLGIRFVLFPVLSDIVGERIVLLGGTENGVSSCYNRSWREDTLPGSEQTGGLGRRGGRYAFGGPETICLSESEHIIGSQRNVAGSRTFEDI
jgi:large subunit ribosomal protein L24e